MRSLKNRQREIFFATSNKFKLENAQKRIGASLTLKQVKLDIMEPQSLDQKYVCTYKTREAYKILQAPVFCEDSGLYIEKFNNFPGILTKFIVQGIGLENIEKLINENESAYYLDTIVYKDKEREFVVSTKKYGYLTIKNKSNKFNNNAVFDTLFVPKGFNVTVNDMTDEEYNKMASENGIFDEFKKYLK